MSSPGILYHVASLALNGTNYAYSHHPELALYTGYVAPVLLLAQHFDVLGRLSFAAKVMYAAASKKPSKAIQILCRPDDVTQGGVKITDTYVKIIAKRSQLAEEYRKLLQTIQENEETREGLKRVELLPESDQLKSPAVQTAVKSVTIRHLDPNKKRGEGTRAVNVEQTVKNLRKKMKELNPNASSEEKLAFIRKWKENAPSSISDKDKRNIARAFKATEKTSQREGV